MFKKRGKARLTSDDDSEQDLSIVSSAKIQRDYKSLIIEVTGEEEAYREKRYPDVLDVNRVKVKCTACMKRFLQAEDQVISVHPLLKVVVCQNCFDYYSSGEFPLDEDGQDLYCRWCGEGGSLYCCSTCSCAFCERCIKRNLSPQDCALVEANDNWECLVCDVRPLWERRALCWALRRQEDIKSIRRREKNKHKLLALRDKVGIPKSRRRELSGQRLSTDEPAAEKTRTASAGNKGTRRTDVGDVSDDSDKVSSTNARNKLDKVFSRKSTRRSNGKTTSAGGDSLEPDMEWNGIPRTSSPADGMKSRTQVMQRRKGDSSSEDSDFVDVQPKRRAANRSPITAKVSGSKPGPASSKSRVHPDDRIPRKSSVPTPATSDEEYERGARKLSRRSLSNKPGPASSKFVWSKVDRLSRKSRISTPATSDEDSEPGARKPSRRSLSNKPGPASSKFRPRKDDKKPPRAKSSASESSDAYFEETTNVQFINRSSNKSNIVFNKSGTKEGTTGQKQKHNPTTWDNSELESESNKSLKKQYSRSTNAKSLRAANHSKHTIADHKSVDRSYKSKVNNKVMEAIVETDSDREPVYENKSDYIAGDEDSTGDSKSEMINSDCSLPSSADEESTLELQTIRKHFRTELRDLTDRLKVTSTLFSDEIDSKKTNNPKHMLKVNAKMTKFLALAQSNLDDFRKNVAVKTAIWTKRVKERAKSKPRATKANRKKVLPMTGSQADRDFADHDKRVKARRAVDSNGEESHKRRNSKRPYRHDDSPKPSSEEEEEKGMEDRRRLGRKNQTKVPSRRSSRDVGADSGREVEGSNSMSSQELNTSVRLPAEESDQEGAIRERTNNVNMKKRHKKRISMMSSGGDSNRDNETVQVSGNDLTDEDQISDRDITMSAASKNGNEETDLNMSLDIFSQSDEGPSQAQLEPADIIGVNQDREPEKSDGNESSVSDFPDASPQTDPLADIIGVNQDGEPSKADDGDASVSDFPDATPQTAESSQSDFYTSPLKESDKQLPTKVSESVMDGSAQNKQGTQGKSCLVSPLEKNGSENNADGTRGSGEKPSAAKIMLHGDKSEQDDSAIVEEVLSKVGIGLNCRQKGKESGNASGDKEAAENSPDREDGESGLNVEVVKKKVRIGPKSRVNQLPEKKSAKELAKAALLASDSSSSDGADPSATGKSSSRQRETRKDSSGTDSDRNLTKKVRRKRKETHKAKKGQVDLSAFGDSRLLGKSQVLLPRLTAEDLLKYNITEVPEPMSHSSEDSDGAVRRLTNLKTLRRNVSRKRSVGAASRSAHSDSSNSDANMAVAPTKSPRKQRKAKPDDPKLADFYGEKNVEDGDASSDERDAEKDDPVKALEAKKNKELMMKRQCVKQQLLDDEVSDDGEAAREEEVEEKKKTKKRPSAKTHDYEEGKDKEKEKKKKQTESKESSEDIAKISGDSDDSAKRAKKKWRTNKLLRGKINLTDSSEDEKRWKSNKEKREKKKMAAEINESSGNKKRKKKIVSDSDTDTLKLSSSEDSDSDFIIQKKNHTKRKKAGSSDSSDNVTSKKVKRRRIKAPKDSSDSEQEERNDSEKGTPGKGRKNIRKVMKEESVGEMTKRAAREEEERRKRIEERQLLYNKLYAGTPNEKKVSIDKLVLDFDPDTKEELVVVHPRLVKKLKPHQVKGVKFMWDACFESIKQLKKTPGTGCILAHCMGLGKTFQVVTLVHTLLNNQMTNVRTVLVVCPLNTVLNWVNEFQMWLKDTKDTDDVNVYELSKYKAGYERKSKLMEWQEDGGVMVINYEMYRNLSAGGNKRVRKNIQEAYIKCLVDPGPDLVVCDEGHLLKNEDSALSKAMKKVTTLRRIVLTGTPLQNNLKEYHCMVQFIKPNLLGTSKEFYNRFVNPITNGQYENSTPHDVKIMKRRAHVLHKMLEGSVQRYDYNELTPFLPEKQEYVIYVRLTPVQISMYQFYLDKRSGQSEIGTAASLFPDWQAFQRICTHPLLMKWHSEVGMEKEQREKETDSEGSLKDFIDDDDDDETSSSDDDNSGGKPAVAKKKSTRKLRGQRTPSPEVEEVAEKPPVEGERAAEGGANHDLEWWKQFCKEEDLQFMSSSGKLMFLFSMLRECENIGDKLLVFSQHLNTLNVIEEFLQLIDEETQKTGNDAPLNKRLGCHRGSWSKGIDYFRLDGSVSGDNRNRDCKLFNNPNNERARLFLISTKAGGLGINLVGANRVIIFDASWNPSLDVQSIFRVFRFGQKKPCYIYRLLAYGTMEEKVYERQITKLSLSCRVVDEQQIERYYSKSDREAMYTFEPFPKPDRPTPILPKDRMLADMLTEHEQFIEAYHEHDSLLENKQEEELTEEERKAAWEDYEQDKKGRADAAEGFTNQKIFHMLLHDRETLVTVLRRDNPTASDEQINSHMQNLMVQLHKYQNAQQLMNPLAGAYPGQRMPYANHGMAQYQTSGINMQANVSSATQAMPSQGNPAYAYQINQYLAQNRLPYPPLPNFSNSQFQRATGNSAQFQPHTATTYPTGLYANKTVTGMVPTMTMTRKLQPSGINVTPIAPGPGLPGNVPRIKVRNLENLQEPRTAPQQAKNAPQQAKNAPQQAKNAPRIVTNPLYAGAAAGPTPRVHRIITSQSNQAGKPPRPSTPME